MKYGRGTHWGTHKVRKYAFGYGNRYGKAIKTRDERYIK